MSEHAPTASDRLDLGDHAAPLMNVGLLMGLVFLIAALAAAAFGPGHFGFRRFYFSYLIAWWFFLSIALGAMFFVLISYVTRAGWGVGVRRVGENIAATIPILSLLFIPILIAIGLENGQLYRWDLPLSAVAPEARAPGAETPPAANVPHSDAAPIASADHPLQIDPTTYKKRGWLNPGFFIARQIFYLAVWSLIATYYRRNSVRQDREKDPRITEKLQKWSGICIVICGLTVTGAAYDQIMSLDPHWGSTIFGGYIFASSMIAFFATMVLVIHSLQHRGWLTKSISVEHFHDMGKYMFAFTFFWGYLAFSQYMLIWYASFPTEITWFSRRGATTNMNPQMVSGWSLVAIALLFGGLLIPFGGLLSRHVKRNRQALLFWAGWLLVFRYVDMYWLIMPEIGPGVAPSMVDLFAFLAVGGFMLWAWCWLSTGVALRPLADPRLPESLAFHNF